MRYGVLFGLLCLYGVAAFAEIAIGSSLEWMAASAPTILRATCVESQNDLNRQGEEIRVISLRVEEVLKGTFDQPAIRLRCRLLPGDRKQLPESMKTHTFLAFIPAHSPDDTEVTFGGKVGIPAVIDLQAPLYVYSVEALLTATPVKPTPTDALMILDNSGLLTDAKTIQDIVKRWATWNVADQVPVRRAFKNEPGSAFIEAFGGWSGSVCYLIFPAAKAVRDQAIVLTHTKNGWDRERAVRILAAFTGAESFQALRPLLQDPYAVVFWSDLVMPSVYFYPVRYAASSALQALGEHPGDVVLRHTQSREEKLQQLQADWQQAVPTHIGKDLTLKSVAYTAAPTEWERTDGDDGIAITAEDPKNTLNDGRGARYHPTFVLFIMPHGWKGRCRLQADGIVAMQAKAATDLGTDPSGHRFFYLSDGADKLVNLDNLRQHFHIQKAPSP